MPGSYPSQLGPAISPTLTQGVMGNRKAYDQDRAEPITEYSYTVLFEPAEEGGFVVTCPALPGLVTEGDTLEEARAMAEDAIRGYIESLRKDHLPIPSDKAPVKEEIRVMVPERA